MPAPGTSGKMPDSRNTVTGILRVMANTRVSRVRGDHRQQGGRSTVCPQHYGQLVDEPAHGPHQPAEEQAFAGARKQDGKAQGADPCNEELRRQLSDLCTGEHHATTTPVKNV